MEKRVLGRTGHASTVITLGMFGFGAISQEVADRTLKLILDHGINHIDIAPSYGEAMERLAPWMPTIRKKMFLGCKTNKRTEEEAWINIHESMDRLGVDSFDLFQLHGVCTIRDLDEVTDSKGALGALIKMREQGLTRWIGITGHGPDAPNTHREALNRFDFDTVMFPLNASMFRNIGYRHEAEQLIDEAVSRNIGIQTIKMIARGGWGGDDRDYATWYDPHRQQRDIDKALWWVLSQKMHTAPCVGDVRLIRRVLDSAQRYTKISLEEQEEIVKSQRPPKPEPKLGIIAARDNNCM